MPIFNILLIKEIINKYFNKYLISNYVCYDDSFYTTLADVLNSIYSSEYYNNICQNFLNYNDQVDLNNLLNNYPLLLECQSVIFLLFKILEQINMIDNYNFKIDGVLLLDELKNNNNFYFLNEIVDEIKFNYDLENVTRKFKKI
jgi:uncharacterized protein (UPF0276 family)